MRIGVPTEIKPGERRVALTPEACQKLCSAGHEVHVQSGAGQGAAFSDEEYLAAGCVLQPDASSLYAVAELVVKVKEPLSGDVKHLRADHLLFCYLHLASAPHLVDELKQVGLTAVAFETVEVDGKTPLLAPMSKVAGRVAIANAAKFLQSIHNGRGTMLGDMDGSGGGNVVVVGAGEAGRQAAEAAWRAGCRVTVLDLNQKVLDELAARFEGMQCLKNGPGILDALLPDTDVLVGAVYVVGKKAPHVVSEEQVKMLPKGAVVVDISIDQGGCIETSVPNTHDEPYTLVHDVIHSAITNMPAAYPRTASEMLSHAIVDYVMTLASGRWNDALKSGVNVAGGDLKIDLAA